MVWRQMMHEKQDFMNVEKYLEASFVGSNTDLDAKIKNRRWCKQIKENFSIFHELDFWWNFYLNNLQKPKFWWKIILQLKIKLNN